MLPLHLSARYRRWLRWLTGAGMVLVLGSGFLTLVGDFGLTQRLLDGVEQRALAGQSTRADRWGLRALYGMLQLGGQVVYHRLLAC